MKPFDLEKAKAGAKVVTRDGKSIRYLTELKGQDHYPYLFALQEANGVEYTCCYTETGNVSEDAKHDMDLFMAPIETVWYYAILPHVDRNLYTAPCYTTLLYETAEKLNEAINTFYKGSAILDRLTYTTKE